MLGEKKLQAFKSHFRETEEGLNLYGGSGEETGNSEGCYRGDCGEELSSFLFEGEGGMEVAGRGFGGWVTIE